MNKNSLPSSLPTKSIRISLGIVYLWFGALKFFPGYSPAEQLAMDTIDQLSFHLLPGPAALFILASWEVIIGLGLLFGTFIKPVLILLFIHLAGTFTPLILFRDQSFHFFPFGFSLLGQYIFKNIVYISAGWMLWTDKVKSTTVP